MEPFPGFANLAMPLLAQGSIVVERIDAGCAISGVEGRLAVPDAEDGFEGHREEARSGNDISGNGGGIRTPDTRIMIPLL